MAPYAYPEGNAVLLKTLNLLEHPEGGYYAETVRTKETAASPFADGAERNLATQIYYLLTPESSKGKMHMNKSITFHTLHQGRTLYTLVKPLPADAPEGALPEIKNVVMGEDSSKGEASEIPAEDLASGDKDSVGALISEVVVPGFSFEDHQFLSEEKLVELFRGNKDAEGFKRLMQYVRKE
ncbi:hypothetical protein JCM10213v2_003084 [Rhodosporidiobolus nylandii]